MGHYAKVDENNIVVQVIVAKADYINTLPDKDSYIKTSYNTRAGKHFVPKENQDFSEMSPDQSKALRGNYAGIGYVYDPTHDIFYDPLEQAFPSWTLNTTTGQWEPPVAHPGFTEEQIAEMDASKKYYKYTWDEDNRQWVLHETATL